MRAMAVPTPAVERETIVAAAYRVIAHPWRTFVREWNWKAALLSELFRTLLFSGALRGPGLRGVSRSNSLRSERAMPLTLRRPCWSRSPSASYRFSSTGS